MLSGASSDSKKTDPQQCLPLRLPTEEIVLLFQKKDNSLRSTIVAPAPGFCCNHG